MSRTYRRKPTSCFRHPQTGALVRQTGVINDAAQEAREYGIELSTSAMYKNPKSIVTAWEDMTPGAWDQIPKMFW